MASLIVISGPNEGDYYPLGKRTVVVGRDEGCPVQLLDDLVSRKHIQIRYEEDDDAHHALDMKSANGTFVNGRKVDGEVVLQDGDTIELGGSKVLFIVENFTDRESAYAHYKKRGERQRGTLLHDS